MVHIDKSTATMNKFPVINIPGCSLIQANTIQSLVSIPENSTTDWQSAYTYIENIGDGRGYTCGLVGFTSGTHDLLQVVEELGKLVSTHPLVAFLPVLKRVVNTDSTKGLEGFAKIVKTLKTDENWKKAQWTVLLKLYWNPAWSICKQYRLTSALALYIIYDTYLNFGDVNCVIRKMTTLDKAKRLLPGTYNGKDYDLAWLTEFLKYKLEYMLRKKDVGPTDRVDMQQKLVDDANVDLIRPICAECYKDKFIIEPLVAN